jgi:serine/threonine-protein phosphatase 2A activator
MISQSQAQLVPHGQNFSRRLHILDSTRPHSFLTPLKKIQEGHDVPYFLTSKAYRDIGTFVMQLNIAMCPRKSPGSDEVQTWKLGTAINLPESVRRLQNLLEKINAMIAEAPPDTGPRRFGNVSFRKWHEILESRVRVLLQDHLPTGVLSFGESSPSSVSALDELTPYLLGGFGSPQRLDYGTGHELSFLAFLGCIWKLGGFTNDVSLEGSLERSIVVGVIEPYANSLPYFKVMPLNTW